MQDKEKEHAEALKTEAYSKAGIGNYLDAKESFAKAISAYSVLTNIDPLYRLELAKILTDFGNVLHELSHLSDAKDTYEEALKIYRDLSAEEPRVYDPNISRTLNNLANVLVDLRDYAPARTYYEECLVLKTQLGNNDPETYLPEMADLLGNFGTMLRAVREFSLARKRYEEALVIFKKLNESDPDTYRKDIARTLNSLGVLHGVQHNDILAKQAYEEALAILRELARDDEKNYRPKVAMTLTNLGNTLFDLQNFPAAQQSFEEALTIRRELAESNPIQYLPKVATTLDSLGYVLYAQQHFSESRQAYEETLKIKRELAKKEPNVYLPSIAKTLDDLARLLADLVDKGYFTASKEAFEEAIKLAETELYEGDFQHLTKMKIHAAYRVLLKSSIQEKNQLKAFAYTSALRDGQARSLKITEQDLHQTQTILKQRSHNTGIEHKIIAPTLGLNGELLIGLISYETVKFYLVKANAWDKLSPPEASEHDSKKQRYQLARQLWKTLPRDIQQVLAPREHIHSHILISADPFWSAFPWELLRFDEGEQDYLGLYQLLPRIGAIHAPKLERLFDITNIGNGDNNVAVFAPHDTDPDNPLLGTIVETNTIKKVLENNAPEKLIAFTQGQEADSREIARQLGLQPDVFYFSGHGKIMDNEEYLTLHDRECKGLVTYFGRQELQDLLKETNQALFPHHPLIVLNSCVTGRSRVAGGEREDLVATFLELGAGAVIASPIPIQDMVAKAFGETLFHQLIVSKTSISETLLKVRWELAKGICSNLNTPYWGMWGMIHIHGKMFASLNVNE